MAIELFQVNNENWKRITHEARERWIVGVDLGCSVDSTAIAIMRYRRTPLDKWKKTRAANRACSSVVEQQVETRYEIVHIERLALGTPYPAQVQHIMGLLQRDPLRLVDPAPDLVVDATGAGLPVVQDMERAGLKAIKVTITAGAEQTSAGNRHYHVAKSLLISHLDAVLHTSELKFAPDMEAAPDLKDELLNFDRHIAASGRASYAARASAHDDIVLAVALAVWRARGNGPKEAFTVVGAGPY